MTTVPRPLPLPGETPTTVVGELPPGHGPTTVTVTVDGARAEYVGCSGCYTEHPVLGRTNAPWADAHAT